MQDAGRFAVLKNVKRIWVVGSIHGDAPRLAALHQELSRHVHCGDYIVYTGNYLGVGATVGETLSELLRFRRWVLSLAPLALTSDIVYLRGAQEEMWQKLLQIQFAPDPSELLEWMYRQGADATVRAYGGDPMKGLEAADEGALALTYWITGLRDHMHARAGHDALLGILKHAAYSDDGSSLIVNAGLDPTKAIGEQTDSFWWSGKSFRSIDGPYQGFQRLVRGYDPLHQGVEQHEFRLCVDGGCGYGGSLNAFCLDRHGKIVERVEI